MTPVNNKNRFEEVKLAVYEDFKNKNLSLAVEFFELLEQKMKGWGTSSSELTKSSFQKMVGRIIPEEIFVHCTTEEFEELVNLTESLSESWPENKETEAERKERIGRDLVREESREHGVSDTRLTVPTEAEMEATAESIERAVADSKQTKKDSTEIGFENSPDRFSRRT